MTLSVYAQGVCGECGTVWSGPCVPADGDVKAESVLGVCPRCGEEPVEVARTPED